MILHDPHPFDNTLDQALCYAVAAGLSVFPCEVQRHERTGDCRLACLRLKLEAGRLRTEDMVLDSGRVRHRHPRRRRERKPNCVGFRDVPRVHAMGIIPRRR